jgi:hypothetical protein
MRVLMLDVSTEEFSALKGRLRTRTYADLGDGKMVAWLTQCAVLCQVIKAECVACNCMLVPHHFNADGKEISPGSLHEHLEIAMLFFDCWQQASFIQ